MYLIFVVKRAKIFENVKRKKYSVKNAHFCQLETQLKKKSNYKNHTHYLKKKFF